MLLKLFSALNRGLDFVHFLVKVLDTVPLPCFLVDNLAAPGFLMSTYAVVDD